MIGRARQDRTPPRRPSSARSRRRRSPSCRNACESIGEHMMTMMKTIFSTMLITLLATSATFEFARLHDRRERRSPRIENARRAAARRRPMRQDRSALRASRTWRPCRRSSGSSRTRAAAQREDREMDQRHHEHHDPRAVAQAGRRNPALASDFCCDRRLDPLARGGKGDQEEHDADTAHMPIVICQPVARPFAFAVGARTWPPAAA